MTPDTRMSGESRKETSGDLLFATYASEPLLLAPPSITAKATCARQYEKKPGGDLMVIRYISSLSMVLADLAHSPNMERAMHPDPAPYISHESFQLLHDTRAGLFTIHHQSERRAHPTLRAVSDGTRFSWSGAADVITGGRETDQIA
ncbi:hypothetical protein EDD18DRAFT_1110037 [Armillaria luteobubalina]|uniref:Uncharacterized protein n=1 Tax=Armillaria luteobubalina TaxID=153913 RepID=A0AA39PTU1_9AGAR|nr:hypothetical protein EDD18DRAFT_1110037 [Armillaria luteobubalina]